MRLAIDALAKEPKTATLFVLDDIIIARPFCVVALPPPFRRYAFGSLDAQDAVGQAPPGEAQGRPIGHFRHDGNLLGRIEKGERARGVQRLA